MKHMIRHHLFIDLTFKHKAEHWVNEEAGREDLAAENETLPEAQRTQAIESKTWIISTAKKIQFQHFKPLSTP